jgi:hypothetical protein
MLVLWPHALRSLALSIALSAGVAAAEATHDDLVATIEGEVLHANTLIFLGLEFQDVVATPMMQNNVLRFEQCRANLYGGTITATITIDLDREIQNYHLEIKNLDIATFLRGVANVNDGTSGKLDASFDLSVPSDSSMDMTGNGEIHIRDGSLFNLSAMLNLFAGDPSSTSGKDTAVAHIEIAEGHINLKAAGISGPSGHVKLRGFIGLDGNLHLTVIPYPKFGILKFVPGIGDIASWLLGSVSSLIAKLTVRGHISHPVIVRNPFADSG